MENIINKYINNEINTNKNISPQNKNNEIDNNISLDQISIKINEDNEKENEFNNNLNNEDMIVKFQNTLEKANRIIGGEKVKYLINNFKNINFTNQEKDEKEEKKEKEEKDEKEEKEEIQIINYINDYSFKLNDSNSNEINSYKTSKFYNSSQLISDEKRNDQNDEKNINTSIKENNEEKFSIKNIIDKSEINQNSSKKEEEKNNLDYNNELNSDEINNDIKNNSPNTPSIQLPPTIQLISGSDTLEEKKNINKNENNTNIKKTYNFTEEELEKYREILSSLNEYLKLITQRNTLNDIITYGDMKYKYKIGFEQLIIVIKSIPFNIIRAIQQTQYYHIFFRQLFIPFISRAFNK